MLTVTCTPTLALPLHSHPSPPPHSRQHPHRPQPQITLIHPQSPASHTDTHSKESTHVHTHALLMLVLRILHTPALNSNTPATPMLATPNHTLAHPPSVVTPHTDTPEHALLPLHSQYTQPPHRSPPRPLHSLSHGRHYTHVIRCGVSPNQRTGPLYKHVLSSSMSVRRANCWRHTTWMLDTCACKLCGGRGRAYLAW